MTETLTRRTTYIGAGLGIFLFATFGVLNGAFLGGVMGLGLSKALLGDPFGAGFAAKMLVRGSMLFGVGVSGVTMIFGGSSIGWLIGSAADTLAVSRGRKVTV